MYGTVARIRVKPGAEQALMDQFRAFSALHVAGYRATYAYRMDADANEFYLAIVFDSKASYRANAESAEQDQRYREMLPLLEGAPEWHDGEILVDTSQSA
ncbi:MAG TPA: antibiotic biosynthesis monooxygenase [Ktedonobacterales bacterium]|jgi:heme-degrading monooxygenase HmoA